MIEIEKKFLLTKDQQELLLEDSRVLGVKMIQDSYFDTDDYNLTKNDLWFRLRDNAYELKAPLNSGNSSLTNQYHEITDNSEIAKELKLDSNNNLSSALLKAGIKCFVTCNTNRKSFEKDGFRIDIDEVTYLDSDYKYSIVEIELIVDDEAKVDEAEQKIIKFAKQFDLVTDQIILGKVLMYLKLEAPAHYEALLRAGVLKQNA